MKKLNLALALMIILLIGSFPAISAYFGKGNFEVPGSGPATDTDGDGIPDWWENLDWWRGEECRLNYTNASDAVLDFDGDGFSNLLEYGLGLNPCLSNVDSDLDDMPDKWEDANGLDKFNDDGALDPDSDGLGNVNEYLQDADPQNPDTDSDTMLDGWEYSFGLNVTDPTDAAGDLDADGVNNSQEHMAGTDPTKAPFNTIISTVEAGVPTPVDAMGNADTALELTAVENLTDVSVNITKYTNISRAVTNPLSTGFGLASGQQSIGKGIVINADENLRTNLSSVLIKIFYTDAELDRTGDGDADDVGDIDQSSLEFWRYCPANNEWQVLDKDRVTFECGNDSIQVFDSGVNTTSKFIYVNMSTLGVFGVVGTLISEIVKKIAPGGGGGLLPPKTPPPVFKGGVIFLTPQLLLEVILKQKLGEKTFWTVPASVGASLVLTGEYPTPFSPIVRGALSQPIKMLLEPLRVFRGKKVESSEAIKDIYRFSAGRVLAKYSKSEAVVIAVREPPVDSMAAVAYAKSIDAPILLTEPNDAPEDTINAVKQLNPRKVIIIGGPAAVSEGVESEFKKIAPTERIWGQTRYETAVEIAERVDSDLVVITDGEAPSLDAVIVASEYKAPIIYVKGSELPESTKDFLLKHKETERGRKMSWIVVDIDEGLHTELHSLYTLPEFLTKNRLTIKLYQLGTRFLT